MPEPIPRIAFTPGEPAGIGPDLCALIAQQPHPCELITICDPDVIYRRAKKLGISIEITQFDPKGPREVNKTGQIKISPVPIKQREIAGQANPLNAQYVLDTISLATQFCLDSTVDAITTGPVHKGIINEAGIQFSGHTEYIAKITGGHPVMMLATPGLRVALATTHIPVSHISHAITDSRLTAVLSVLHKDLITHFDLSDPRILVCGLNPHAGENGHLGREEIEVISPTLERLKGQGMQLKGPLPADTLFTPQHLQNADAVLAMYHDQGLPVLKYAGFENAVNITLGLPVIRTSVDHGTALNLAGSGEISTGSAHYALKIAIEMSRSRKDEKLKGVTCKR